MAKLRPRENEYNLISSQNLLIAKSLYVLFNFYNSLTDFVLLTIFWLHIWSGVKSVVSTNMVSISDTEWQAYKMVTLLTMVNLKLIMTVFTFCSIFYNFFKCHLTLNMIEFELKVFIASVITSDNKKLSPTKLVIIFSYLSWNAINNLIICFVLLKSTSKRTNETRSI